MKSYFKESAQPSGLVEQAWDVGKRQAPLPAFQRLNRANEYSFGKQLRRIREFYGYVPTELVAKIEECNAHAT